MANSKSLNWNAMRPGLVRFLSRRTGCAATAEDLAQDLWFRVGQNYSGEEMRNPEGYIFRAAANIATDHARSEKRREALVEEAKTLVFGNDMMPSPEHELGESEELAHVYAALDALPERTREIFAMHRFDGISYRGIAKKLGLSSTTVEKHIARAINALAGFRDDRM